jgi:hypothetical protein
MASIICGATNIILQNQLFSGLVSLDLTLIYIFFSFSGFKPHLNIKISPLYRLARSANGYPRRPRRGQEKIGEAPDFRRRSRLRKINIALRLNALILPKAVDEVSYSSLLLAISQNQKGRSFP